MSFEIIICTKNRPADLSITLDSILTQNLRPKKIVIVDSGTASADYQLYQEKFNIQAVPFHVITSAPGLTHQRNIGVKQIEHELVLFLDDDVLLEKDYLKNLHEVFEWDSRQEIGGATGKISNVPFSPSTFSWLIRSLFFLPLPKKGDVRLSGFANSIDPAIDHAIAVEWLSGCNMAYRKEVFDFNWFDENLTGYSYAEDVDFSYRISKTKKLIYCPQARLQHRISPHNRLHEKLKAEMLVANHHYLFKKNIRQSFSTRMAHLLSLKGIILQKFLLERTWQGFKGALWGFIQVLFLKNYKLPNYLERLDFKKPQKIQYAEHLLRYNFIKSKCENKIVLDCASGEGIGTDILKENAQQVIGVDIDFGSVQRASQHVQGNNVKFIQGSALQLPFADESIDVVTSVETLEHVPAKFHNQMISEFHRVLKKGGILYLTTPNKDKTSPNMIAARNYFHIAEIGYEQLLSLLNSKFSTVNMYGVFNPLRDAPAPSPSDKPAQLTFKKAIMLMTPMIVKDMVSVLIKKRHIYPSENEYIVTREGARNSSNLVAIAEK